MKQIIDYHGDDKNKDGLTPCIQLFKWILWELNWEIFFCKFDLDFEWKDDIYLPNPLTNLHAYSIWSKTEGIVMGFCLPILTLYVYWVVCLLTNYIAYLAGCFGNGSTYIGSRRLNFIWMSDLFGDYNFWIITFITYEFHYPSLVHYLKLYSSAIKAQFIKAQF